MRLALALVAAVLALVLPARSFAATARVVSDPRGGDTALYEAGDGEVNDLTLEGGGAGSILLTDPGAVITAQDGCTATGDHSVTCSLACSDVCAEATLGDQKDRFTSKGPSFFVRGGAGDDALDGGDGFGALVGDDGDDVLEGGAGGSGLFGLDGDDTLTGGDGSDVLQGGEGADTMDGGDDPGDAGLPRDLVSYRGHAAPVTIDMATPGSAAGAAGEGDTLKNVENALGSNHSDDITATADITSDGRGSVVDGWVGDDTIHGGPGADELHGGAGDDLVAGGGGNDRIGGEEGNDRLLGGRGSNRVLSMDGSGQPGRDFVNCGDAGSVVPGPVTTPLLDVIDQSCRRVDFEQVPVRSVAYSYDGRPTRAVNSAVACTRHCLVRIALRTGTGKRVGAAEREIGRGQAATLTIQLTDEARARLAQAGVLRLRFSMTVRWGARLERSQATSWQLRLHDPPAAR